MSDRITSRNRETLPKTIYDFINQIVGEVTTLQHRQATLLNGLMRDASDIVGNMTRKVVETGRRGNPF